MSSVKFTPHLLQIFTWFLRILLSFSLEIGKRVYGLSPFKFPWDHYLLFYPLSQICVPSLFQVWQALQRTVSPLHPQGQHPEFSQPHLEKKVCERVCVDPVKTLHRFCKGLVHRWVLVPEGHAGTKPLWILRRDCAWQGMRRWIKTHLCSLVAV